MLLDTMVIPHCVQEVLSDIGQELKFHCSFALGRKCYLKINSRRTLSHLNSVCHNGVLLGNVCCGSNVTHHILCLNYFGSSMHIKACHYFCVPLLMLHVCCVCFVCRCWIKQMRRLL